MADERQDADRRDRDRERSTEAHWQAAEAGADEPTHGADEPTQTTREGLEIPVPKRKDVFEVFERAAKGDSDSGSRPPKQ